MKDQRIFDQLKLRLGYGIAGNQNIDDYAFLSLYTSSVNNGEGSIVAPDRRGTKDIKWEKQKQFNAGIDMAFLNNKIRFSVDGFIIKNKDLLMKRPLSTSSGFKEAFVNIGAKTKVWNSLWVQTLLKLRILHGMYQQTYLSIKMK